MKWAKRAKQEFKIATVDVDRMESFAQFDDGPGDSLMLSIIELFMSDSPKMIDGLKQASVSSNGPTIHKIAHSLKSSSSNIGATRLAKLCEDLEGQTDPESKSTKVDFKKASLTIEQEFTCVIRDLEIIKCLAEGRTAPRAS